MTSPENGMGVPQERTPEETEAFHKELNSKEFSDEFNKFVDGEKKAKEMGKGTPNKQETPEKHEEDKGTGPKELNKFLREAMKCLVEGKEMGATEEKLRHAIDNTMEKLLSGFNSEDVKNMAKVQPGNARISNRFKSKTPESQEGDNGLNPKEVNKFLREVMDILVAGKEASATKEDMKNAIDNTMEKLQSGFNPEDVRNMAKVQPGEARIADRFKQKTPENR